MVAFPVNNTATAIEYVKGKYPDKSSDIENTIKTIQEQIRLINLSAKSLNNYIGTLKEFIDSLSTTWDTKGGREAKNKLEKNYEEISNYAHNIEERVTTLINNESLSNKILLAKELKKIDFIMKIEK